MRIAIVEDEAAERALLQARLENQAGAHHLSVQITCFSGGEAFLAAAREQPFAAAFLDIYMDGMDGLTTARALREFDPGCLLVFTTTSADHALEGFRVRAMHYLVKPYGEEEIAALVEEFLRRVPKIDQSIVIKAGGSDVKLSFRDIVSAEHYAHQIYVKTAGGRTFVTRQSFAEFTGPLKSDDRFFICSRGAIVNLEHTSDVGSAGFTMADGSTVGISRDLAKAARQAFMDHLFRKGHTQ